MSEKAAVNAVAQALLEIKHLSLSYSSRSGPVHAVRDVSLRIHRGETYGLVGESGCGKSSLAYAIMGHLGPVGKITQGHIQFQGQELVGMSGRQLQRLRGNHVAMVYQDPQAALDPSARVGEQIAEVLTVHRGLSREEAWAQTLEIMKAVNLPDVESVAISYPHQLSGGMQQRVVIAMALCTHPELLIMDEPTTGLDVTIEAVILDLVSQLKSQFDSAILYITHDMGVIARVCARVAVMYAGEIVEEGSVGDIFYRPAHPYTCALLRCIPRLGTSKQTHGLPALPGRLPSLVDPPPGCAFAARCEYEKSSCMQEHHDLVEIGPNHWSRCAHWARSEVTKDTIDRGTVAGIAVPTAEAGELILEVSDLKAHFGVDTGLLSGLGKGWRKSIKAVDGIGFKVHGGTTLGLVGESGCGKSTIAKCIIGVVPPTDGSIRFRGKELGSKVRKRSRKVHAELQMVFQNWDSTLNPSKTVEKNVGRALELFGGSKVRQRREAISALLRAVQLDDTYLERYPHELSGGEKQRAAIARAFAGNPKLVVCDEVLSALDVSVQAAIINLLIQLQQQEAVTYVFISHDLSVVRYLCDHVAVIYLGHLCEIGPAAQIFAPPYHPYTEALLSAVPVADPNMKQSRIRLPGSVPSPRDPPSGCVFHTRCHRMIGTICETTEPPEHDVGTGHRIYCHIPIRELKAVRQVISDG
jgi:peptide/nickel transport system ATP-binding protein